MKEEWKYVNYPPSKERWASKEQSNKPYINHIDANRRNNCVDNLEWCTQSENAKHCAKLGRVSNNFPLRKGEEISTSKLTTKDVLEIKKSILSNAELGRKYGVSKTAIRLIRIGKNWKDVTA